MRMNLKDVGEQVIVVTGASSGIGLATALMAARQGACVVLNSRGEDRLRRAARRIVSEGGRAVHSSGDVADKAAMERLAASAVEAFGRIDTWINNAGVGSYGRIEEGPLEDARRLFETNYWGVVNGSLAALPHLRAGGGALINVGSILSSTAYPLQGHYTASKHAVKGFTDALRLELEEALAAVSVTLIQPVAVDTPHVLHAGHYLGVHAPEVVAEAILHCAAHRERDLTVGGAGKLLSAGEKYVPRLFDRMKEAVGDDGIRTQHPGRVMRSSVYTLARLNRGKTTLLSLAVIAGMALASRGTRRGEGRP
jgi:NAD(P)-dependent dehydrogenase (short-subunit alcohol dehydrogenase family)